MRAVQPLPVGSLDFRWAAAVTAIALLAIAGAMSPDLRWLHYLCKPLATLSIAAMVYLSPWSDARYRGALVVGLLLSTLGDIFLMLPAVANGPDWFVFGLASFLLAHVAYLFAFCSRGRFLARWWPFALYALIAVVVSAVLKPHLPAALQWPVNIYVLLLSAMAAQACAVWARLRDRSSALAALGGAFFIVSDATLALDRFVQPLPAATVIVLATYWTAQLLIGFSARRLSA